MAMRELLLSGTRRGRINNSGYAAVYHLDETSGSHMDATSNNNDSVSIDVVQQGTATGQINGADEFDGVNDYVGIDDSVSLSFVSAATIGGWIKLDTDQAGERAIVRKNNQWALEIFPSDNKIRSLIKTDGVDGWTAANDESFTIDAGTWYYFCFTWDGSILKHYANGAQVGSNKTVTGSIVDNSNAVYIGSQQTGVWLDGVIDEVRISNVARTTEWVEFAYLSDNGVAGTAGAEEAGRIVLVDAVILETQTDSFTADASLVSGTIVADAVLKGTQSSSIVADTVLKDTLSDSFTVDTTLLLTTSDTFTADTILKETQADSFTVDACLTSDATLPEQYLFTQAGAVYLPIFPLQPISVSVTSNHIADYRSVIFCDATSGSLAVTLPDATNNLNKCYTIKHTSGSHSVIVQGEDTIDGAVNQTLSEYEVLRVMSDNTEWWVL